MDFNQEDRLFWEWKGGQQFQSESECYHFLILISLLRDIFSVHIRRSFSCSYQYFLRRKMFPWHFLDIFPVCILRNWQRWWFRTRVINISAAKWQTGRYLYFSSDCPDIHYKAVFSLVCMPSGLWLVIRKYSRQTDRPHSDHKVPLPPLRSLNINTLCG